MGMRPRLVPLMIFWQVATAVTWRSSTGGAISAKNIGLAIQATTGQGSGGERNCLMGVPRVT